MADSPTEQESGPGAARSAAAKKVRGTLNDLDVREWMRFTKSWFICNPKPRSRSQRYHPAKFPEELVAEFIRYFTKPGEWVLDPFSGVGTTVSTAAALDRSGVGIELSPEFYAISTERAAVAGRETYVQGDARDAARLCRENGVAGVQYVLTSPPYWDMLRQSRGNVRSAQKERSQQGLPTRYSGDHADLGNIDDYEAFLEELTRVLGDLRAILAPGRYLTVVIQNVRVPGGEVRPLAWDLTRRLAELYTFKGERIWLQDNKRLGCWGWPSEFVTNVHHHYCLNFKNDRGTPAR